MPDKKSVSNHFPLVGENIRLCVFTSDHISNDYVAWLNDPEVVKFSNQRFKQHDLTSCRHFFESFEDTENLFLAIHMNSSDKFIGTMTAYRSIPHGVVDMGIMVGDRSSWGKGVGQEAWGLLMSFLLETCETRKVTGGALSCNQAMVRIMERSQMLADGRRVRQELVDNSAEDIVYFAKFRDE